MSIVSNQYLSPATLGTAPVSLFHNIPIVDQGDPQQIQNLLKTHKYVVSSTPNQSKFYIYFLDSQQFLQRWTFKQTTSEFTFKNGDLHRCPNLDTLFKEIKDCFDKGHLHK